MNSRQSKKAAKRENIRVLIATPRKQLRNRRRAAWVDETYYIGVVAQQRASRVFTGRVGRYPNKETTHAAV